MADKKPSASEFLKDVTRPQPTGDRGRDIQQTIAKPSASKFLSDVGQTRQETSPSSILRAFPTALKTVAGGMASNIKTFGKGAVSGATFNTLGQEPMEGSVFEQNPEFRKAGKFVGSILPIAAAELTGGASLGLGAAARGATKFGTAIANAVGSGLTYEGIKGAITGRKPLETLTEAPKTALAFAGLGAVGQGLGYLRNAFGKYLSEDLINNFINTDKKIAEKVAEQGKPSLGEQALNYKSDIGVGKFNNRKEVLGKVNEELFKLENRVKGRLETHAENAANLPNGQPAGTIDFTRTAKTLDDLKSGFDVGTEPLAVKKLENMKNGIIAKNGNFGSVDQAMILKRKLDDLAGNIYLKSADAKSALKAEAYESMANDLRKQIYSIDPVLGELAGAESLMLRIRTGLMKTRSISKSGGSALPHGMWSALVNHIESNPAANATAGLLRKSMGEPSQIIAPITGYVAKQNVVNRNKRDEAIREIFPR